MGGADKSPAKAAVSVFAAESSLPGIPFRSGLRLGLIEKGSGDTTADIRESMDASVLAPNSGVDFLEVVLQGSGLIDLSAKDRMDESADDARIDSPLEGLRSSASNTVKHISSNFLDSSEYLNKASRAWTYPGTSHQQSNFIWIVRRCCSENRLSPIKCSKTENRMLSRRPEEQGEGSKSSSSWRMTKGGKSEFKQATTLTASWPRSRILAKSSKIIWVLH